MKINDIVSIFAGGSMTLLLWRTLILFVEPSNFLAGFPCSAVGGYVAGRLKTSEIPSGAVSGIIACVVLILYMGISYGDWSRSVMFGVIMGILWIIGGVLGDLIAIMRKNRM